MWACTRFIPAVLGHPRLPHRPRIAPPVHLSGSPGTSTRIRVQNPAGGSAPCHRCTAPGARGARARASVRDTRLPAGGRPRLVPTTMDGTRARRAVEAVPCRHTIYASPNPGRRACGGFRPRLEPALLARRSAGLRRRCLKAVSPSPNGRHAKSACVGSPMRGDGTEHPEDPESEQPFPGRATLKETAPRAILRLPASPQRASSRSARESGFALCARTSDL